MGNKATWTDEGLAFCINPANTRYKDGIQINHVDIDPTDSNYDGTLVGINSVMSGLHQENQGESNYRSSYTYLFNRKPGLVMPKHLSKEIKLSLPHNQVHSNFRTSKQLCQKERHRLLRTDCLLEILPSRY
jgi:hypothetical protein